MLLSSILHWSRLDLSSSSGSGCFSCHPCELAQVETSVILCFKLWHIMQYACLHRSQCQPLLAPGVCTPVCVCVCVCVCVRECDQISGSGIFMSSVWIRNTPTTNLGCTFLRALRSSEKLQHQTSSYFVELRKANTFLPCIIQDQAKLVEHRLNQSLTNSVFSHVRLPSFSKWTTSRLSPNRCLLTGNCRYVFWTEPSQAVFEKLLTDVMWPAQALYLLRFG